MGDTMTKMVARVIVARMILTFSVVVCHRQMRQWGFLIEIKSPRHAVTQRRKQQPKDDDAFAHGEKNLLLLLLIN